MVAPALLPFEVASVCLKKRRLHPELAVRLLGAMDLLARVELRTMGVDHAAVVATAEESGLTTYDASCVWLAHHLDAELVTLDEAMGKAVAGR